MQYTIEKIAEALRDKPSVEVCDTLTQACEPLRAERRARLLDITATDGLSFNSQPAGYRELVLRDPEAVEPEQRRLRAEIAQIDALESACADARENALNERARKEVPAAVKRLKPAVTTLRHAFEELTKAIEKVNEIVNTVGDYPRVGPFPLSDDELARLVTIRNAIWSAPSVAVLTIDSLSMKDYPTAWPLLYERRNDTIRMRQRPRDIDPFEYSSEPVLRVPHVRRRA